MQVDFFGWFMQYPNVGHKICMFNEKKFLEERNCGK
jgi:hypothetical protein